MSDFRNFNDASQNPPRLRVGHSLWSLDKLPFNSDVEWTFEEKLARVKNAGFEHLKCWIADENEGLNTAAQIRDAGLAFTLGNRPMNVEAALAGVERARKWGAQWVMCQPATAFHSLAEVVQIVRAGAKAASDAGLCYFVETHRNNFTETLPQTLQLIEAVPDIKMTADFSHFVVVGEFYGWQSENALEKLRPVIEKTGYIHGRISNGEQVQVDVGDGSDTAEGTPAGLFLQLWTEIARVWKKSARNGDVLPFTSELGPPRYAITTPEGLEISDRWAQSLVMKSLMERAWNEAK